VVRAESLNVLQVILALEIINKPVPVTERSKV
jgi:hypothetical protein